MGLVVAALVRVLVEQLGACEIDLRVQAQRELIRIGLPAYAELATARFSSDPERVSRVLQILRNPTFRTTPEYADLAVQDLGLPDSGWIWALWKLVQVGERAQSRLLDAAQGPLSRFRARQWADILESKPVSGLRFGVIVESPSHRVTDEVPGFEIFINAGPWPMVIDTWIDAAPDSTLGCLSVGVDPTPGRTTAPVLLLSGQTYIKRRRNLLYASTGWKSLTVLYPEEGEHTLSFEYTFRGKGFWNGRVRSHRSVVRFSSPSARGAERN